MTDKPVAAQERKPGAAPEEALPDEMAQLRDVLRTHGKTLITAACAVLLAVSAVAVYKNHKRTQARKSWSTLFAARAPEDLRNLLTEHPSSAAAPLAMLAMAKSHFDSGTYAMALTAYGDFLQAYPAHSMALTAEMGKIHCQEALGQLEEALQGFERFRKEHPGHYLLAQAILGQARCLEQLDRLAEAKIVYEDFIAANPASGGTALAEESLEAVNRKIRQSAQAPPPQPAPEKPPPAAP
jgi:tetratricopeptide (TPR) repeat protein